MPLSKSSFQLHHLQSGNAPEDTIVIPYGVDEVKQAAILLASHIVVAADPCLACYEQPRFHLPPPPSTTASTAQAVARARLEGND